MPVEALPPLPIASLFAVAVPWISAVWVGPRFIRWLQSRQFGQFIREDGPQGHQSKAGTPTGGGVLLLGTALLGGLVSALAGGGLTPEVAWVWAVTLVFGLLGFSDDWLKISKQKNKGISGYTKLWVQALIGLALGAWMTLVLGRQTVDVFGWGLHLGWAYPLLAAWVVTATSNAVNLTDGLDGLAGSTTALTLLALSWLLGSQHQDALAWVAFALVGGILGFLRFNRYPARLFMGDTGSLALGGAIAALALLAGREVWLLLLGGIFVAETLSVILQVASFKLTGKRIFRMSPLHHHFELGGWHETRVVKVFTWVQLLLCVLAVVLIGNRP